MPKLHTIVADQKARVHVGAVYLTGDKYTEYKDSDCNRFLGRIGAFILAHYPNSTLAKAEAFKKDKVEL